MGKKTVIIGAGASGMTAAYFAAAAGAEVTLLEKEDRAGKKILMTGNGHANIGHKNLSAAAYHGTDPLFPPRVFAHFPPEKLNAFWTRLGLATCEEEGRIYPLSREAKTVRDLLEKQVLMAGGKLHYQTPVTAIQKKENGYAVLTEGGYAYTAETVILAAGSPAGPKQKEAPSGFSLAESLGEALVPPVPALCPLQSQDPVLRELSGVRQRARLSLYIDRAPFRQAEAASKPEGHPPENKREAVCVEEGEVQFLSGTLSGIPAFQLSCAASRALLQKKRVTVAIDFLPELTYGQLLERHERLCPSRSKDLPSSRQYTAAELLRGLLPQKTAAALLQRAGIEDTAPAGLVAEKRWAACYRLLKDCFLSVSRTADFARAQVAAGGVATAGINPATMMSAKNKGLFFCGEVVDVDGRCGGYNLEWAFVSGALAGSAAAR